MSQGRRKGILMPSYLNQHPSKGKAREFKPGYRYDINRQQAENLRAFAKDELHEAELIDLTRRTRYVARGFWQVWTTEGRRLDVFMDDENVIISTAVQAQPDLDIPPRAR